MEILSLHIVSVREAKLRIHGVQLGQISVDQYFVMACSLPHLKIFQGGCAQLAMRLGVEQMLELTFACAGPPARSYGECLFNHAAVTKRQDDRGICLMVCWSRTW